jgi:hypothetical protein
VIHFVVYFREQIINLVGTYDWMIVHTSLLIVWDWLASLCCLVYQCHMTNLVVPSSCLSMLSSLPVSHDKPSGALCGENKFTDFISLAPRLFEFKSWTKDIFFIIGSYPASLQKVCGSTQGHACALMIMHGGAP